MTTLSLSDLAPTEKRRVMDLVQEAGIDVNDWVNFKDGPNPNNAASNPKYCYEWTFQDPERNIIIINLWYDNMEETDGGIFTKLNMRLVAETRGAMRGKGVWKKRAYNVDFAIQKAVRLDLPIRVIVCDGQLRETSASSTEKRMLDSEPWFVSNYDSDTGEAIITRGLGTNKYLDQFDLQRVEHATPSQQRRSTMIYSRSAEVRRQVLKRAQGTCELCEKEGFRMANGRVYLETHHVIPLCENGPDSIMNVVALCPNHHREAHHGMYSDKIQSQLLAYLRSLN